MKIVNYLKINLTIFLFSFFNCIFAEKNINKTFTPVGAEIKESNEGLIPEWNKYINNENLASNNNDFSDHFLNDSPIEIIDKRNYIDYVKVLPFGLSELVKKIDDFKISLYPTIRSADYPDALKQRFKSVNQEFDDTNLRLNNLKVGDLPFRFPKSGEQIIWNHLLRYQGGSIERKFHTFVVNKDGNFSKVGVWVKRVYKTHMDKKEPNKLFYALGKYFEPATLVGDILLVHENVDQLKNSRKSWIYNEAQKRVRRAPDVGYDAVGSGSQGLITADQVDAYNGAPDRYEWKLLGKKNLIVPYNCYKLNNKSISYKSIIKKGSVNFEFMRYEYHRVWVIEANLKSSSSHIYSKRVFYVDEDSWSILVDESYSKNGDLWRVAIHGMIQLQEQNFPWYRIHIHHDLINKKYYVSGLDNEVKKTMKIGFKGKLRQFQPNALRRMAAGR